MVKNIKIGNKSYDMKASVLTLEKYKRLYDKDLLSIVSELNNEYNEALGSDNWIVKIQSILLDALRIAHLMIQEQNPSFVSYEDWIKDLDSLLDEPLWISEVLKLAMSPFRSGLYTKKGKKGRKQQY